MQPMSVRAMLLPLLLMLLPTGQTAAQDCGNWSRPVLCEVELRAARDRGNWERFDPYRRLQVAPNQTLEIELVGRDQYRREFPRDRIALEYDGRDCDQLLAIESRGNGLLETRATATSGSCRLGLWVPGNLNFEWQIEIEISASARAGYTRAEAELIVRSLYRAVFARDPDDASFNAAVVEVQRGNLLQQVQSMVRSPEFFQKNRDLPRTDLLDRFYQGLLNRPVDSGGIRTYLPEVQRGNFSQVLLRMIQSGEFEQRLEGEAR